LLHVGTDRGEDVDAPLGGTALGEASLTVAAANADFGRVALGTSSKETVLTVTNGGDAASGTPSISVSGNDPSSFAISSNDCPTQSGLAAGASCHVGVTFDPAALGAKSASLTVSADPGGVAAASLAGTGFATLTVLKAGAGAGTVTSNVTP